MFNILAIWDNTSYRLKTTSWCLWFEGIFSSFEFLGFTMDQTSFVNLKPRPNARNMPTQHIPTLLGATCCMRFATVLRCVATCWVLLAQIWPASNLSQQHATCRNMSQQGGPTYATCCTQQLLRYVALNVVIWDFLSSANKGKYICAMIFFDVNLLRSQKPAETLYK